MKSLAKTNFEGHANQADEAIEIYSYLRKNGYNADFGLRFVWVSAISSLDHYISELIIEKSTEHFANEKRLSRKALSQGVPLESTIKMKEASGPQSIVEFRSIISDAIKYKTFQKADDISDGLSYIWEEKHKWEKISQKLGVNTRTAKRKLNSIGYRRDSIVHNADFDDGRGEIRECILEDAKEALDYIKNVVNTIEELVE